MELTDFSRIKDAVDLRLVQNTHIVGVGAGGSFCLFDALVRSGIGQLTVLDFDHVEATNLVRQGYDGAAIGRPKVEALGEHLFRINSGTKFTGITKNFLDMDEDELDAVFGPADVLLFMTDSFKAQAFGNKLALRYQKPAIWAGYYERSQCAEIVFSVPGTTPGCFRCAVSDRYVKQAEQPGGIAISSNCNMMMHSMLVDSLVGLLTMAILHNGTSGYEFSNWFGDHWNRNLIQFKVHPNPETAQGAYFQTRMVLPTEGRGFNFNAIWQEIKEENPANGYGYHCPDCGGTGDLRDAARSIITPKNHA